MIIYRVENLKNGKVYIGLTTASVRKRWLQHVAESKRPAIRKGYRPFAAALKKYGAEGFKVEEICCAKSLEDLNWLEEMLIQQHGSLTSQHGYNVHTGGRGSGHQPKTKSHRKALSLSHTGKKHSFEHRQNMSLALRRKQKTFLYGEKHPLSKLSNAQREEIKVLHAQGISEAELARRYNVGRTPIRSTLHPEMWRDRWPKDPDLKATL